MKKLLIVLAAVVTFSAASVPPAAAAGDETIKVGLRYGSSAMSSANLENDVGQGYEFGWFDSGRSFVSQSWTEEEAITMTPSGYGTILVTITGTDQVLYESEGDTLGVLPTGRGGETATWFRGYRYAGGFEYRLSGGGLTVINVVDLEDYVKGVIPYEMGGSWPLAALEAQAVCARTYACRSSKHLRTYGFDVCSTTDCQVYYGLGSGNSYSTDLTDQAVDNTAGLKLYYQGDLVQDAVYHASNGGATEDAENVWGTNVPYLRGKSDPYEAQISIPDYSYTVTYTWDELTWVLQNSGYSIGAVVDAYVSEYTPLGNVGAVTFVDDQGKNLTLTGERAKLAFYSSTLNKNVRSQRFTISGGTAGGSGGYAVNGTGTLLSTLHGAAVISGSGEVGMLEGESHTALTASGTEVISDSYGGSSGAGSQTASGDGITITGTGSGHNVGLSQYGARAMAELGYSYREILQFYFTDVTIE